MKILVTGANGQLGKQFQALAIDFNDIEWIFCTKEELDITNASSTKSKITAISPTVIINCAAYTAVDKAEDDQNSAFRVNEMGVANLASTAKSLDIHIIHFSTDYVYHLLKSEPLNETDICQPKGIYGKSKRAGELALINSNASYTLLRVSWLYSTYNNNFVKTMLKLGNERESISIVNDQIGAPTYSKDLAADTIKLILQIDYSTKSKDIYNYCNSGQTNWAAFARKIFESNSLPCNVNDISTEQYGAKAPRPKWSVLNTSKIQKQLGIKIKDWEESLSECLEELNAMA